MIQKIAQQCVSAWIVTLFSAGEQTKTKITNKIRFNMHVSIFSMREDQQKTNRSDKDASHHLCDVSLYSLQKSVSNTIFTHFFMAWLINKMIRVALNQTARQPDTHV